MEVPDAAGQPAGDVEAPDVVVVAPMEDVPDEVVVGLVTDVAVGVVVLDGVVGVVRVVEVVGLVEVGADPVARLGNVGWSQQLLESALAPDCAAWSNVMTIRPSCLYAGDASIFGITDFRNVSAAARPARAPGVHG